MDSTILKIRGFNRFYTSYMGLLNQYFLESPYSLTEVRILYEIGEHHSPTAQNLCDLLTLDKGYVSRIVASFIKKGIISKRKSDKDARSYTIELTKDGEKLLLELQNASDNQIQSFARTLGTEEKKMLINSMEAIQDLLAAEYDRNILAKTVKFREGLRPGDIGSLIHLHGKLYADESGFSLKFEAYVAKTFYDFLAGYSAEHDRIWIAEYHGRIVGCIAIVYHGAGESQLRWFLTDPLLRGTGIGRYLLKTALDYCLEKKYKNVFLYTGNLQSRAIKMYEKAGFVLSESKESSEWGQPLFEQRFDLKLA